METKFRMKPRARRDRGEGSRTGMETRYAMGMRSHACVSSDPAGGSVRSFFPFVSFSPSCFCHVPPSSSPCLSLSLSLSLFSRTNPVALLGPRFSVPVGKLVVLPIPRFLSALVAFRPRISDSPLNNCPLPRKGPKGYAFEEATQPEKVHPRRRVPSTNTSIRFVVSATIVITCHK